MSRMVLMKVIGECSNKKLAKHTTLNHPFLSSINKTKQFKFLKTSKTINLSFYLMFFYRGEISSTAGDLLKKDKTYFAYQTAYHAGFTGKDCRSLSKACSISPGYLWKHFLLMNPLRYAYNNRH